MAGLEPKNLSEEIVLEQQETYALLAGAPPQIHLNPVIIE